MASCGREAHSSICLRRNQSWIWNFAHGSASGIFEVFRASLNSKKLKEKEKKKQVLEV